MPGITHSLIELQTEKLNEKELAQNSPRKAERNCFTRPRLIDAEFWITKLRRDDLKLCLKRYRDHARKWIVLDFGSRHAPYRDLFEGKVRQFLSADLSDGTSLRQDVAINPQGRLLHPDESVDVVLSLQVLEHVSDVDVYLQEAHRVLKPGGILWLTTHGMWPYHPAPEDYHRWTLAGLKKTLGEYFTILDTAALMGAPAYAWMIYMHWGWAVSCRLNGLQARLLNEFTRSQKWGKTGARKQRITTPWLYLGSTLARLLSIPINLVMVGVDAITPRDMKNEQAAVYRVTARKTGSGKVAGWLGD